MAEYIERGALMQFPIRRNHYDRKNGNKHFINGIESVLEYAENLPAADVAPVVHGRWIMVDDSCGKYACSVCREIEQECTEWGAGHYNPVNKDYCPNCGAKMDEKENDNATY